MAQQCLLPSTLLFRTYKQIDFDAVRLAGCTKPARALRPADSGIVLGTSSCSSSTPQADAAAAAAALPKQVCQFQSKLESCCLCLQKVCGSVCTCLLPSLGTSSFELAEYSCRQHWCCPTQSNFQDAELLVLTPSRLNFCVTGNSQIAFNRRNNARFGWHHFACI